MGIILLIIRGIIVLLGILSITYLGLRKSMDYSTTLKDWINFLIQFVVIIGALSVVWNAESIAYRLYPYLHFDAELLFYALAFMVFVLSVAVTSMISVLNRD